LQIALVVAVGGCSEPERPDPALDTATHGGATNAAPAAPRRIISMAPSITETLFALGAGDQVVGVTRYCDHPPATRVKARIGGLYDPNYEAILALEPDLIVLQREQATGTRVAELGIELLPVGHLSVDEVLDAIITVARRLKRVEQGERLVTEMRQSMDRIAARTRDLPRPRVLVSIGRTLGTGSVKEIYIAGADDFYSKLVELAGGRIAHGGTGGARYPKLSAEALLRIDPDIVVEVAPDLDKKDLSPADILAEWKDLDHMRAVREGRIHVLSGDHTAIPGPRSHLLLRDLARLLHPEIDWSTR